MSYEAYTDAYIESAFSLWVSLGCPSIKFLHDNLEPDQHGRIPHEVLVRKWATERGWYERQDAITATATVKMDEQLAEQTVEMWKRQATRAAEVAQVAYSYIKENGFDSSASAIKALEWAQEEERKTRGAEAFLTAIKDSSSQDLIKTIRGLAERQSAALENEDYPIDMAETPERKLLEESTAENTEEDAEP